MKNEIILNRMYAGDYLRSDNNIGHEIINLFQADNVNTDKCRKGKYFVYINSDGFIGKEHDDKVRAVLMVRGHGKHILEVLAKTEGRLEQWAYTKYAHSKRKGDKNYDKYYEEHQKKHREQVGRLKNVTYGGVHLSDIFAENTYDGNKDNEIACYVTFKAEKIIKVKEPIYLVDGNYQYEVGENMYKLEDLGNLSNQDLKMYVLKDKHFKSYNTLANIINNPDLWGEAVGQVNDTDQQEDSENDNIFKIIKKEYDELVVSNMLAYYLEKYRFLFADFIIETLKINILDISSIVKFMYGDLLIEREKRIELKGGQKGQIDLLIKDTGNKNIIVIENKIKSGINGISGNSDSCDIRIKSQLTNYYNWIQEQEEYNDYNKYFYVFVPDYNKLDVAKYDFGDKYKVVYYSEIYNCFKNVKDFLKDQEGDYEYCNECFSILEKDKYYKDFLALLEKHSQPTEDFEKEILRRFNKIINKIPHIKI